MLMLLFQVGEVRWAIAANEVSAVVPNVGLQKMSHYHLKGRSAVVGFLNYHSEILPAVDVSALIGTQPAPPLLSTRIVIAEANLAGEYRKLALVVERAGETMMLQNRVSLPAQHPYVQSALENADGEIIQQLAIAPLLEAVLGTSTQQVAQPTLELSGCAK